MRNQIRLGVFEKFIERILNNPYVLSIGVLGILGLVAFLALPAQKKKQVKLLLPFLILILVVFYENFGAYLLVNKALNQTFHEFITDVPFKGWNLWFFNIFNSQLSKILFLLLLLLNIRARKLRRVCLVICVLFVLSCIALQVFGIEPINESQPIIYLMGNSFLIICGGLFFIDLISNDYYLDLNPLTLWEFWYITLILFQSAILFMVDASFAYLAAESQSIYFFFNTISMLIYLSIISLFVMQIASEVFFNPIKIPKAHV
jgi:hypothetical protein